MVMPGGESSSRMTPAAWAFSSDALTGPDSVRVKLSSSSTSVSPKTSTAISASRSPTGIASVPAAAA